MPSASVVIAPTGAAPPAYGAHTAAWTPITRTCGRCDFTAIAIPLARPPPPSGTTTVTRSGMSSTNSAPSVPWPATTAGSSNGWQKMPPSASANSRAAATASSSETPCSTTLAPSARHASILVIGAPTGRKMSQGTPKWRAANASAWA